MFDLFKKKISAQDAAHLYIRTLLARMLEDWDNDVAAMNKFFEIDSENGNAFIEFVLAIISLELRAVINISLVHYPIVSLSLFAILRETESFEEISVNRIQQQYLPAMRASENDGFPVFEGTLSVLFKHLGIPRDPISGTAVLAVLMSKTGIWKSIIKKYKVVES